ncbi:MAG TPA: UbiA family prenyltransferase [Bacteroidia bacterium]|nr:UbiA family prenyltransferase [Bacteroidia bacterium]
MTNSFSIPAENSAPFLKRFWIYQKERFPLFGHGPLVASFSFSAIAYSRICRGAEGFVPWSRYAIGIVTTITLFLLVRIFDEFKDRGDDEKYRPELPVPRGLVTLRELAILGACLFIVQVVLNAVFFPKMFFIYCIVIVYLCLMGKEFFVPAWLKKHQFWYVTSHMFIIPLIDIYASGLDWLVEGQPAPKGLMFFFAVSYFNGIVLEIGRKIRVPGKEKEGVLTYSSMLGVKKATWLWVFILAVTLSWAVAASWFAGYGKPGLVIMGGIFCVCVLPAFFFLQKMTEKKSKLIEYASALWTIAMYFSLGAIPMIAEMINHS